MIDGTVSPADAALFQLGHTEFAKFTSVDGSFKSPTGIAFPATGLGARFNSFSCGECHVAPVHGGASAPVSNQATLVNGLNTDYGINAPGQTNPPFLTRQGPSIAVRFKRNPDGTPDGGVHQIFTIANRADAPGCQLAQPDFTGELANNNVVVRITTPTFGDGLIEAIPDERILANRNSALQAKLVLGISGHENRDPHTALITKFGWKAQLRTLLEFSADAFLHEMGVTNSQFPNPSDSTPGCQFGSGLEDQPQQTPYGPKTRVELVTQFMKLLAPPKPAAFAAGDYNGQTLFNQIGCNLCHTPTMNTGASPIPALANRPVALYSDLLVHRVGQGLRDDITQGAAGPDEFRTAPLWGLGQRVFFLHDGRTTDLKAAIAAHQSPGSEANQVVARWLALTEAQKQDLLNFLRKL